MVGLALDGSQRGGAGHSQRRRDHRHVVRTRVLEVRVRMVVEVVWVLGTLLTSHHPAHLLVLLTPLLQVDLGVPLLLVTARELPPADVAGERLLARVRAYVRGKVVRPREGPHADSTLERFLARVDADVPCKLVRPRKPPITVLHWAGVGSFVHWCLAWPVRVLSGLDRHQLQRQRGLLVDL